MASEANSTLRARLRRITESERERRCGVSVCYEQGPAIVATGRPGAWGCKWSGVLTCGHIWTCPVCSVRIRGDRCKRVLRSLSNAGGRWQMLTLTVRHRNGMPLRSLLTGLLKAWRGARQGGAIQRLWSEKVTASVRATEVNHSRENGWHPHLHVLLRTDEWTEAERELFLARWLLHVGRALGPACVPSSEHAVDWAEPIDLCKGGELDDVQQAKTRYMFKLGLEVAGSNKRARKGSRSSWQVAEDAALRGDSESVALWLEYARATKGRRMIELDDRAQRFAKKQDAPLPLGEEAPVEKLEGLEALRIVIPVDALELRALRAYERHFDSGILATIIGDVQRSESPETVVKAWLDVVTGRVGYSRCCDGQNRAAHEGETEAWGYESRGPPPRYESFAC